MKKMGIKKWLDKVLAGLLCGAMIAGNVPATVFASETIYEQEEETFYSFIDENNLTSDSMIRESTDVVEDTDSIIEEEHTDVLSEPDALLDEISNAHLIEQDTVSDDSVKTLISEGSEEISQEKLSGAIKQLSPLNVVDAQAEGGLEPFSDHWYRNDANIQTDLSNNKKLAYSLTVSDITQFSGLPAEYDRDELLEWGKDPGLGVDILHKHGFDGTGSVIAYVDQPIKMHEEYQNLKLHYTNNTDSETSMHGPAVLSLLAGKDIGTAPGAEVYYYAHASWKADQTTHAECLYQIIDQNKKLQDDKKIRMVGFSDGIDSEEANEEAFREAVKACEDAGIMVWFCQDYAPATFGPESDRINPDNAFADHWWDQEYEPGLVYVPAASRTTAANLDGANYIYWGDGGLSWTMPYALGIYADALAIDPTLTKDDLKNLIVSTATMNANGLRLINPIEFIATVLERAGRNAEAESLRLDYKKSFHYFYAIMDKNKMSSEDIKTAEDYLRTIKGVTVLEVDASICSSSSALYTLLKGDTQERGGIIDGIQIFGTPEAVPAFEINYRVQMPNEIDEGGTIKTDLFYGNFKNDVSDIGSSYSVYDHFKDGKNITLTPDWPVVRLPLKKGQYASYFGKYNDFALQTRYSRLPLVNFSNPIFASSHSVDDMSTFLDRACNEFAILAKNDYRLYANLLGQYPVENSGLLGGFTAENLTTENKKGVAEFLINSHGQQNNIDKCWYENNEEKRESLINSDTINSVLSDNPYYLDCWTCNNGWGMEDNLTTKALTGDCVGMFSATTIISNNGVNCRASLDAMKQSNFYWFYYNYLKSLNEGNTRASSFYNAQVAYADALIADSKKEINWGANYQFNLYNLFAYENFGVVEPGKVTSEPTGETPVIPPEEISATITQLAPLNIADAQNQGGVESFSTHWWGNDASVKVDLSKNKKLAYSLAVSDITQFSGLPAEYDRDELLEWGKDPGLGVDILHKHGFDGTGVVIAYEDQQIIDHEQYKDLKIHYTNNSDNSNNSMHGPAVLSLLAGKDIGTAPGVEVYYYASRWAESINGKRVDDQVVHAECLYQIIEQNEKLPEGKKIRMVGFSNNIKDDYENDEKIINHAAEFEKAVKDCEDAGIMVWFCGDYGSATFGPESDRNNPDNVFADHWEDQDYEPDLVYIPAGSRTTAATMGGANYIYWGDGGLSWTMPYALGIYADALAIDPTLTKNDLKNLIVSTATMNANGLRLINPIEFIATVLERVGRNSEADSLRLDYKKTFHYFYALMDKTKMTAEDISAAEEYLRTIKGVTVLEVDVSNSTSAELYKLLKKDAQERGGIVDGIQIFGTPEAIPAFDITYRVQMPNEIDEGGSLKTDLFYGNFKNDGDDIGSAYSVYDQFNDNIKVTLKPDWPVVRLPLGKGQYADYFAKYSDFALKTRYGRLSLVNFSNPIFASSEHIDDMGLFLDRANDEFSILGKNEYRLYGNLLGQYPVENNRLLGGFTADNLTAENRKGVSEFLINSHGQKNNIDKCWYENNEEKRESLINSETINSVLSDNPYYLDCWTCSNGWGMDDNLTTKALTGDCVGVFSATTIISNNGVNCRATLDTMKQSNFYWFYYNYLKSLHEGNTRASSFYNAQTAYADSLMVDSTRGIRGEGNYQFNLYNLLAYENFGVMEPGTFIETKNKAAGKTESSIIVAGQKIDLRQVCFPHVTDTISRYVISDKKIASVSKGMLMGKKAGEVKVTAQNKISKNNYENIATCTVTVLSKPKLKFSLPMTYEGKTIKGSAYFTTKDTNIVDATLWESSNPAVVEVTDPAEGKLVARKPGSAKITAYFGEKGKKGTLKVSAKLYVKIPSFKKASYNIQTGGKVILAMKNVTAAMNPSWSVNNTAYATASPQIKKGVTTGKVVVTGLKAGETKLKAIIDGQEYYCNINVTAPKISKSKLSVKVNKTATISLKNTKLPKSSIEWHSDNESIATVAPGGKIKGISIGETVIWTETGGVRNECVVTVK